MKTADVPETDSFARTPTIASTEQLSSATPRWTHTLPTRAEEHSLLALLELSQEISSGTDPYRVAEVGLLNFMGHLGASCGAIWIFSKEETRLPVLLRNFGAKPAVHSGFGEAVAGQILELCPDNAQPVSAPEIRSGLDAEQAEILDRSGLLMFGLLYARGEAVGMIGLGRRVATSDYAPFQMKVFEASLHHLGVSLENTLLFGSMLEKSRELNTIRGEMVELDMLKEEFQGNLHHELRTPLTVILCQLDLVLDMVSGQAETRDFLQAAMDQGRKLERLVINLLDFRDSRHSDIRLDAFRTNVCEFLNEYVEERRPGVSKDLRELTMKMDQSVPDAMCDRLRVRQILDELVDNAIKFTPQGSKITVTLTQSDIEGQSWIAVSVEDNGPGIPDSLQTIVFEPFRQLDGSMTREVGGIGLGLSLARELAENMNGRLELRSGEGEGVTATVLLPSA